MIKLLPIMLIGLLTFGGCAPFAKDLSKFPAIELKDGVGEKEAVALGQWSLNNSAYKDSYKSKTGMVLKNRFVEKYKNSWFVVFEAKKFDMAFWTYLVVINKRSGDVEYSSPHVALDHVDYDFVFEGEKGN